MPLVQAGYMRGPSGQGVRGGRAGDGEREAEGGTRGEEVRDVKGAKHLLQEVKAHLFDSVGALL